MTDGFLKKAMPKILEPRGSSLADAISVKSAGRSAASSIKSAGRRRSDPQKINY